MIAIISDVHGNYPALCAVIQDIDRQGVKTIYSLGDLCGYYSMVNEVIELIKEKGIVNIMGNHDNYIVKDTGCPRSRSANRCLEFQKKVITKKNLELIKKSLQIFFDRVLNMVHGGWVDNLDEYLYETDENYFLNLEGKFFFSGHTHIPKIEHFSDKIYCNPGSVGQPRDGDWRASYALLDLQNNKIIIRRVEYDIEAIAFNMRKNGFSEHYYTNLYKGTKIGA